MEVSALFEAKEIERLIFIFSEKIFLTFSQFFAAPPNKTDPRR